MGLFSPYSKSYAFLSKISNIAILNFWWVITSVPVVTFGAATTAMYSTAYKIAEEKETTVTRDFFAAFKSNFKQSTQIWLPLAVIGGLLGVDIWFWSAGAGQSAEMAVAMRIVGYAFALVWVIAMLYAFALQARYDNTPKNTVRNGMLYAYRNPGATIMLLVLCAAAVYLNCTIVFVNLLFLIYGFGWFGYMAARIHLGTFDKQQKRHDAYLKKQAEQAKEQADDAPAAPQQHGADT